MGKKLIIHGADFSMNGIAPEFVVRNYIQAVSSENLINSPINFPANGKIEAEYSFENVSGVSSMFGYYPTGSSNASKMFRMNRSGSTGNIIGYINTTNYINICNSASVPSGKFKVIADRTRAKIDGLSYVNVTETPTTESVPIAIFGTTGYSASVTVGLRLYSFKMFNDKDDANSLILDAVPAQKQDGTCCLYDRVSGEYIYVNGGENPICG